MTYFTNDDLIAKGVWSGNMLEVRSRMSDYLVDGSRFGEMPMVTKSPSPNDTHLDKNTSEITTAAMIFSYLRYERLEFVTRGIDGRRLERPDLDVKLPDDLVIGVEVADVSETAQRKHESGRNLIEVTINDLIDRDALFREALGNTYFSLILNGVGPDASVEIRSKKEAQAIAAEVEAFVRSGQHTAPSEGYFATFPLRLKTLGARGAQYNSEPAPSPYFSLSEGAGTIGRRSRTEEVIRVLDDHRSSARTYRPLPTWIMMLLTDPMEYFYGTIHAVAALKPPIHPFVRAYLSDAASRVIELA